jgi:RNA polymerase sigma factor (sigma-70 family)
MCADGDESSGSVTRWIAEAKAGDLDAARRLWERYFERLLRLCQKKMPQRSRRAEDEEDVVVSALESFYQGLRDGRFARLDDRDDLWRLLATMTHRKAVDHLRHHERQKRGASQIVGESTLDRDASDGRGIEQIIAQEPTPQFAALVAEACARKLSSLGNADLQRVARRRLEGYSNEEIARELACSVRTIERKLWIIRSLWSSEEAEDD